MSVTLSNEYLGLAQGPIEHEASSIVNAVCGESSLKIGDVVGILPDGTGVGFTQPEDLLPRVGKISFSIDGYGIVVGGDFEGVYSDGVINLDPNGLALGLVVSFFGDGVRVCTQGRCLALADGTLNGAINVDDELIPSSTGLAKSSAIDNRIIAKALQPTAKANSIIAVDVKREGGSGPNPAFKKELTVFASEIPNVPSDWFDTNFKRRIPIIMDRDKIEPSGGSHTDFPLLFKSTVTDFIGNTKPSGEDFRFVLQDGTVLDYEIQFYDDDSGELIAWTLLPIIEEDTLVYLYYDNPAASDAQNPAAVWTNYRIVSHMEDNLLDSTANNFDGTGRRLLVDSPAVFVDSQIHRGVQYTDSRYVQINSFDEINQNGLDEIVCSFWFKGTEPQRLMSWQPNSLAMIFPSGATDVQAVSWDGGIGGGIPDGIDKTDTVFQHVVVFWKRNDVNGFRTVIDGLEGTGRSTPNVPIPTNVDFPFFYGSKDGIVEFADGIASENRFSDIVRTINYYTTEFNNQSSPSTFYTLKPTQVIDGEVILTDFPLLVSITDTDLRDNALSNGFDIFFTKADGTTIIPYERTSYDGGTGKLFAWVLVNLSDTVDNKFFMFYGDPNVTTDSQNPLPVWDTRFQDVYHMNESAVPFNNSSIGKDFTVEPDAGNPVGIAGEIDTAVFVDEDDVVMETVAGAVTNADYFVSAWIKLDVIATGAGTFFDLYNTINTNTPVGRSSFLIGTDVLPNSNEISYIISNNVGGPGSLLFGDFSDLNFHHIAVRYNSSFDVADVFFDGDFVSSGVREPEFPILWDVTRCGGGSGIATNSGTGRIDELRVAYNNNFTDSYVTTSFNNQKTAGQGAGNFVKVGSQEPV